MGRGLPKFWSHMCIIKLVISKLGTVTILELWQIFKSKNVGFEDFSSFYKLDDGHCVTVRDHNIGSLYKLQLFYRSKVNNKLDTANIDCLLCI